ncbi:BPSL0761 family protein [Pseudomonas fluorescens]|uniref:BPSL0761 family protein n=1 Tax=Pseudomonas fluorescens TaxID=294 RepID=UPI001CD70B1B|nr:BPSL0761 family protein [Pseudomonas fluorescens]
MLQRDDAKGLKMTMPNERTRAVIQTGEFLLELSRDSSLPERIRHDAKHLLRHYPNQSQMLLAGRIEEELDPSISPMGPVFSSTIESSYHTPITESADVNSFDERR